MAQLKEGSIIKKVSGNELIATKEDVDAKIAEKVKTDVPSGAKFTDTVYSHPTSHPASMITQTASDRFVTDSEKANWNSKAPGYTYGTADLTAGSSTLATGTLYFVYE